jgi:streptogramin lyase
VRKLVAAAAGISALAVLPGPAARALTTHSIGEASPAVSGTAAALAASGGTVRPGTVTEIPLGSSAQIYLFGLTAGPDGNVWFADQGCMGLGHCAIGRLSPQGQISTFERGLNRGSLPSTIVTGADGDLWFTDDGHRPAIGRITPQGRITEFSRGLRRDSQPFELTATPAGDVWFTDQGRHPAIGRITPQGHITEFRHGLARGSVPFGIAAGTDAQIWFTDRGCSGAGHCAVGRITASGQIAELRRGLRRGGQPLGIAAAAGGEMWFADSAGAIGQVSPGGQITEHTRGLRAGSSPVAVTAGPDGAMWFTDEGQAPAVGRVTGGGAIREFSAGVPSGSEPAAIAPAADGRLWFTDEGSASAFGVVAVGTPAGQRAAPHVAAAPRPGVTAACSAGRFATWMGLQPSAAAFSFDGYRWLRNDTLLGGHRKAQFTPTHHDAGARLSCRETVTYPPPLNVTVAATSAPRRVAGRAAPAAAPSSGLRLTA